MKKQLTPALAAGVPVVAGEAPRARAEALTAEIIIDLGNLTETFWRIGERLHAIIDERLFAELGYARFGDYVEARLGVAIAQAYKMVRVIRNYVRGDAERIGIERAVSLIRYAKHVGVDPGELVRQDAVVGDKPVSQASVREIESAAVAAYAAKTAARKRSPAARKLHQENRAISEHVAGILSAASLRGAKLTFAKGDLVVRIDRQPLLRRLGS